MLIMPVSLVPFSPESIPVFALIGAVIVAVGHAHAAGELL